MIRTRVALARLFASLALLLAVTALIAACGSRSRELAPGIYRATLELPGGELPFGLDVAREDDGWILYLVNGEERVRVTDVTAADGRLEATLPGDANSLTAEIRGRKLTGEVTRRRAGGEREVLPLRAEPGQAWRFFETPSTDNADVTGRWAVTFIDAPGPQRSGVAEFTQSFERVTGTIRTPTGELRVLMGEVRGDELYLSRFDGASAELFKARVDADGHLVGEYWSGMTSRQTFRAERNPGAEPDTDGAATPSEDPAAKPN
jgi:hypothetical protein